MRLTLPVLSVKTALLALPLALSLAATGCVTRTVYVVDDDPRPAAAAPTARAEASAPYAEPAGGGGGVYVEDQAGIHDESDFYEPLSPYGSWVAYPGYGQVFVPATAVVGAGFRPYTHGHWENTEYGYTWVDHHPFGWATGHYGRWFYDSSYGWVWVPGRTWAPAWVSWRSGGGYVGWAPMPPGAVFGGAYTVYDTSWSFVSYSHFGYGYVGSALIIGPGYRSCYTSTYPYRDTYVVYGRSYYRGPPEDEIRRGGGRVVHRPVRDIDRERPVTRPPEGTTIARNRDRGSNNAPSGSSRGRDDNASGRDDARGSERGRDDAGRDESGSGRDESGAGRGRDDERAGRDTRGSVLDDPRGRDVNPRDPRENPRGEFVDGRGDVVERPGSVVEPRPIVVDPQDADRDPRGGRVERPSIDDRSDDVRSPYIEDNRPQKQYPENPDRFNTERPSVGAPSRQPVGPVDERAPARGPSFERAPIDRGPAPIDRGPATIDRGPAPIDRGPATIDRGPSVDRGFERAPARSAPSMDRAPAPSRSAPSVAPSRGPSVSQPVAQPQGEAQPAPAGKKDSKKATTSKSKSSSKSKR